VLFGFSLLLWDNYERVFTTGKQSSATCKEGKRLISESDRLMTRSKGLPIRVDASKCKGCLVCELCCSLRFVKAFSPAKAAIEVRRRVQAADEYQVSINNDRCDYCGICVRYCSYGALTQEKDGRM
jgi:formate hydrogenlyase subunit 6/NADH:ubiquinone oxidoreductase subunit I